MFQKIIDGHKVNYLFVIDNNGIKNYYKMKEKNGMFFSEEEKDNFIKNVVGEIQQEIANKNFDLIAYPETRNKCFLEILNKLSCDKLEIKKRDKNEVLKTVADMKLIKSERFKLNNTIREMSDIKIGLLAGNQRNKIAKILFEKTDAPNKKVLFMDDSLFTGSTLSAIHEILEIAQTIVVFCN